ncbi:putative RecE [Vibrio phage vB_Vp_PvVp04_M]|nr:putative RecE [Vibrio phage vB_Vp_PvVp04_M]
MKKEFRELINKRGHNVQSFSIKCGVQRNTVYSFGRGAGGANLSTIRKFAKELKMKPSELLKFMGE